MLRIDGQNGQPLKISAPYRDFAVVVKARSMEMTERVRECGLLNVEP